ncbi:MAG: membrane dipeptidase [Gammaproteobacteria bacterium]|nr:membrane dipeptidase [Gammaproteobacteria bacterium]
MQRFHFAAICRRAAALCALVAAGLLSLAAGFAHAEDAALAEARAILARHPLIDGHNDLPNVIRERGVPPRDVAAFDLRKHAIGDTDIARLRAGGVGGQFWSVYIPSTAAVGARGFARAQLEQIDIALRMIERYPEAFALALTADDLERATAAGRIASLLGIEGGHAIENSLGALRAYYRLGVRYMTLTHFDGNDWADSATAAARHGGLSKFGIEVVREMNRLGMLVDLSHVSEDTMNDVLDVAEAPVIFSHSNARALSPTPRNVPDAVLRRLPQNGGVVMLSFISLFAVQGDEHARWQAAFEQATGVKLGDAEYDAAYAKYTVAHPEPRATLADVADHVEYLRDVAGIDHVGIGADFFGEPDWMAAGLEDVAAYPALFAELLRRGWSEGDLARLARGNVLRVLRQAEQAAAGRQRERPPSHATIEQLDGGKALPDKY